MTKEQINKILKEADNVLGNFTDGQIRSHLTINKNRANKKQQSKGGKTSGLNRFLTKTGIFSLSKEERKKYGLMGALTQSKEDKVLGGRIAGKLRKDKGKPVLMFDKVTNAFIKEFPSVATAARFLNKRENKIRAVLSGERKTAYGFIWKFVN